MDEADHASVRCSERLARKSKPKFLASTRRSRRSPSACGNSTAIHGRTSTSAIPIGTRIKGKVRNLTAYGAFIEMEEGIDGMVHVSDLTWTRKINHP